MLKLCPLERESQHMHKNRGLSSARIIKTIQLCLHKRRLLDDTVCNATRSTGVREAYREASPGLFSGHVLGLV